MQRALDAGAVVLAELADARDDVVDVLDGDLALGQHELAPGVAGFRLAAEIHHDFEEVRGVAGIAQRPADMRRHR